MKNIYSYTFHLFLITFAILTDSDIYAQCKYLEDSLKLANSEKQEAELLNELSWCYQQVDPTKALRYGKQALQLSQDIGYKSEIATAYNRIGIVYGYQGKNKQALVCYQKALVIEGKMKNTHGIARAKSNIARVHWDKGNYVKAIVYYEQVLSIFQQLGNLQAEVAIQDNLGLCYFEIGDYTRSLNHLLTSLKLKETLNDSTELITSYNHLGRFYTKTKNYKKALGFYKKSQKILENSQNQYRLAILNENLGLLYQSMGNQQEALKYLEKSLKIDTVQGFNSLLPSLYNSVGLSYLKQGKHNEALTFFQKSIQTMRDLEVQNNDLSMIVYNNLGILLEKQGKTDKAHIYFKIMEPLLRDSQKTFLRLELLYNLSNSYASVKDYSMAISLHQQYTTLRDSLERSFRQAMYLKDEYEKNKQEKIVKEAKLSELEAKNSQKNTLIIALLVTVGLLGFTIWAIIRAFQKQKKARQAELLAQESELKALQLKVQTEKIKQELKEKKEKIDTMLKEQEYESMNAMLKGQEEERNRIAKELHDRVGSLLSMVKVSFDGLKTQLKRIEAQSNEQYQRTNDLLSKASEEVRNISHTMASGVLRRFGLVSALQELKNTVEESGIINIKLFFTGFEGKRLDADREINIYRIIQELISNTLKHADAQEIEIQLFWKPTNLNITVEDNGKGFVPESTKNQSGIGLYNVQSRVNGLEGNLEIDSKIGRGTTVIIDIPL